MGSSHHGHSIEAVGIILDHLGGADDVSAGVVPTALLDRLADAGQRLGAVTGQRAGRVDEVLEPRPAGQPGGVDQQLVDLARGWR